MSTMDFSLPASSLRSSTARVDNSRHQQMRGWGIQGKLYSVVSLLAVVTLLATAVTFSGMQSYHDQVAAMTRASERALLGERIDGLVTAVVMDSREIYMAADKAEAEKFNPGLLNNLTRLGELTQQWLALAPGDRREQFSTATSKVSEFIRFRTELVRLARENTVQEARLFGDNDANRSNRSQLNKALTGLVQDSSTSIKQINQDLEDFYRNRVFLLVGLCLIGLVAGITVAILAARRGIVSPLTDIVAAVSTVVDGNLDIEMPGLSRKDEIGALALALAHSKTKLLAQREQDRQLNEHRAASEKNASKLLLEMCEMLEADVESTVVEVLQQSQKAVNSGE